MNRVAFTGDNAFYKQSNYKAQMALEFSQSSPPSTPAYTYTSEKTAEKVHGVVWRFFHWLVSLFVLPAQLLKRSDSLREGIKDLEDPFVAKRISIEVDGKLLDVSIVGREDWFDNGKWTIYANGNNQLSEKQFYSDEFGALINKTQSNAIVFNYPGVGASQGSPSRETMVKAHKAVLQYLEEEVKPKEIISYGFSIGGAVQMESFHYHKPKEGIKYTMVTRQTFSDLASVASSYFPGLGKLIKWTEWNFTPHEVRMHQDIKHIVLQTGSSKGIANDGVINADCSLAMSRDWIPIPEKHNEPLSKQTQKLISDLINS